jgi:hypothetical protein
MEVAGYSKRIQGRKASSTVLSHDHISIKPSGHSTVYTEL